MTISKGFLDSLHELEAVSNEDCTCADNFIACRKCFAEQEMNATHERVKEVLDIIETDYAKK